MSLKEPRIKITNYINKMEEKFTSHSIPLAKLQGIICWILCKVILEEAFILCLSISVHMLPHIPATSNLWPLLLKVGLLKCKKKSSINCSSCSLSAMARSSSSLHESITHKQKVATKSMKGGTSMHREAAAQRRGRQGEGGGCWKKVGAE
jgi:hypothetical protein